MWRSVDAMFWKFWWAALLANVGDGIRLAALPLLGASLTTEPVFVGAVTATQALPWLFGGLAAGSLADRKSAHTLITVADVGRVSVLSLLAGLILIDKVTIGAVLVAACLLGLGEIIRDTAAQTVIPRLVNKALIERANGRLVAAEVVGGEFVGPPVGGALFVAGAAIPFIANGAALALCVLLIMSIPLSVLSTRFAAMAEASTPIASGVMAGLRWLKGQRVLCVLLVSVAAVALADSAWFALLVLFVGTTLDLSGSVYGLLLAVGGVGGSVGAMLAEHLIGASRHRVVLTWSLAVSGITPAVLIVVPTLWALTVVVVMTSASFAVLNVAALSLRHRLVPTVLLGRTTAAARTLTYGAAAVGAVVGGLAASEAGMLAPFALSGLIGLGATLAWLGNSRRGLDVPQESR
jgi:MFS family permease